MKVLFLTDYFPPETGSASFLYYELAKELVSRGDEASVVTGFPRYHADRRALEPKYKKGVFLEENMDGIKVLRIRTANLPRKINILRGLDQFITAFLYFLRALFVRTDRFFR